MTIDKAKFRKPVVPGDQIRFEMDVLRIRSNTVSFRGQAIVDGTVTTEAEMMAMIVDRDKPSA
jgi:3-hydroxymyristoyl/3-hydroxydecanoyl-(acyl carrier protein) dehydratase